tara:strand:+ start:407 stop:1039 length:633 start_codon:yes stop_codon:yes gene_type:complete
MVVNKEYGQLGQDAWILEKTNYKKNGFFVEIGAYDGKNLSNTYVLEKEYNWSGICAECNPETIPQLINNRSCAIETRALMHRNNLNVPFYSHPDPTLSMVFLHESYEQGSTKEIVHAQHIVKTVTINKMLEEHDAPTDIDYISIDTEGTELFITTVFDFAKYNVKYWTIEINNEEPYYTDALNYIRRFFYYHGYESEMRQWDLFVWKQYD